MQSKTRHIVPLALSALSLCLACGTAQAASNEIVLGASVQLTGSSANTGRYYRDAYEMAIDKINEKGGVKVDGKTYKLALTPYDNQSAVHLRVRQYTQLLSKDKKQFMFVT